MNIHEREAWRQKTIKLNSSTDTDILVGDSVKILYGRTTKRGTVLEVQKSTQYPKHHGHITIKDESGKVEHYSYDYWKTYMRIVK